MTQIANMDALKYLQSLPADTVHCMVTSPPYWGLRDYGVDGQLGLEPTLTEYLDRLTEIFSEARRVLRPDGTLWVNMGDGYASDTKWGGYSTGKHGYQPGAAGNRRRTNTGLKSKDLIGQPWRLAFRLQDDGWWLRSDIIWHKTNPLPESVKDRPTKAHEYVFLFTKSAQYWYDSVAVRETAKDWGTRDRSNGKYESGEKPIAGGSHSGLRDCNQANTGRNRRTVWSVATQSFKAAHFATFPEALIQPMILAGCPPKACSECGAPWVRETETTFVPQPDVSAEQGIKGAKGQKPMADNNHWDGVPRGSNQIITAGWNPTCSHDNPTLPGIVLDPFMGAGTTALVATQLGRRWMGCELNAEYIDLAMDRIAEVQVDMFTREGLAFG